jgi:Fatty acid desaturase
MAWLAGQVLLGLALVHRFALLHESGHDTLFRTRWLHTVVGHVAGFFVGIPFESWTRRDPAMGRARPGEGTPCGKRRRRTFIPVTR